MELICSDVALAITEVPVLGIVSAVSDSPRIYSPQPLPKRRAAFDSSGAPRDSKLPSCHQISLYETIRVLKMI